MFSGLSSVEQLEYLDVGPDGDGVQAPVCETTLIESAAASGVPEEEVERRVKCAREEAIAEAAERLRLHVEESRRAAQELLAQRLREFDAERVNYFKSVEGELIQLVFAIARKIIQREAELDPTLLSGLVRIALDRMQAGAAVRVRVAPLQTERWRRWAKNESGDTRWETVPDETLDPADCIVETELGTANFSFEAQLCDLEESFTKFLSYKPAA